MTEEVLVLDYNDVSVESSGIMVPVRLKLNDEGLSYRHIKTGSTEKILADDISVVNWQRLAGGYGIRVFTSNGDLHRFGGFKDTDQSKLQKFFKSTLNKPMTDKEFGLKGWSYGRVNFEGSVLTFNVSSLPAFEIPIKRVSGCTTGKNEVTLEFHQSDDASVNMMEMRFYIPSSELAGDDAIENFQKRVMDKASVITATGDALAIFREIHCLRPRGRYDIKVFPSFIQLHGKTFDFKIPISTVLRLFLLPHQDGRQHFFVVSLDPPIKQGQTRYPLLIFLFSDDEDDLIELPLEEEELKTKYEGHLEKEMSGTQYDVIGRLFKGICNRKITTPGGFVGRTGTPAISCSYKAASGYVYPLERGIIYVHKPPVHIRFDEISAVNFARSGSTTRSFDFEIEDKNGVVHTFSSIPKEEYGYLYDFIKKKKLRIRDDGKLNKIALDDFSGSDDEKDPYLNRVKAEGELRRSDGEEDSSELDSDFAPGEEGSDVAEEFDSNASDSSEESGDESTGSGREDKPKKKEKPLKKVKTVSEKPRKPRKPKKEKDANKPKRAQSAYFLWLNSTRDEIKRKNPGASITDISKIAGQMWKDVKDKSEWEDKASKAKLRYEEEMKAYKAGGGGGSAKKSPKKTFSPTKAGSGSGFKSKEYISEESSSESDSKPPKKMKKEKDELPVKSESESEADSGSGSE